MPACKLHDAAVLPDLRGRAVVAGTIGLNSLDQAFSQRSSFAQGLDHPVPVGSRVIAGSLLAGPASRKPLAQHRLVGLSAVGSRLGPLPPVLVADVADSRDSAVAVLDDLRKMAALAVDGDHAVGYAVGYALGVQGRASWAIAAAGNGQPSAGVAHASRLDPSVADRCTEARVPASNVTGSQYICHCLVRVQAHAVVHRAGLGLRFRLKLLAEPVGGLGGF